MPAVATLDELKTVEAQLAEARAQFPEAYARIAAVFRANLKVGYKNISKLLLGEATPEKLKGAAEA